MTKEKKDLVPAMNATSKPKSAFVKKLMGTFRQLRFMLRKSFLLQGRYWKSTITQTFLGPIVLMLLLYGIQQAVNGLFKPLDTNPVAFPLKSFSKCRRAYRSSVPCISIMYSPDANGEADQVMQQFIQVSQNEVADDTSKWNPTVDTLPTENLGIVKVPNQDFIYNFVDKNPNVTAWGISFQNVGTKLSYELWYNFTNTARKYRVSGAPAFVAGFTEPFNDDILAIVRNLDLAIIRAKGNNEASLNVQLKALPQIGESSKSCPRNPDAIFKALGPVFMLIPMTIIFFSAISTIVTEKEKNLKDAMEMIGLQPVVYWLSHFIAISSLVVINAIVTCIMGYAIGFSLFRKADFGLLFVTFILFGLSWLSFGLFLASVSSKGKIGVGVGFFFVIIAVIYVGVGQFAAYAWYTDSTDPTATDLNPVWGVLMFFPFFNFNKIINDFFGYTAMRENRSGPTCVIEQGTDFYWSNLNDLVRLSPSTRALLAADDSYIARIPAPAQSLWLFFMNIIFWTILALYMDRVIPNENGLSANPFFFLFPSTYGFGKSKKARKNVVSSNSFTPPADEEPDVTAARKDAYNHDENIPDDSGLRIKGVHKRYDSGFTFLWAWFYRNFGLINPESVALKNADKGGVGQSKVAIREISLVVDKGEMLALLGSNGAGKTSLMKIMYGSSPMTDGQASIFGLDVQTEMGEIRKNLGVCPQFDLLFPDLSAKEHIELWCGIKGITHSEMLTVMTDRLKQMKLWNVRDQLSSQFSGGMKRRLSVILSTIGDPKCVFLDEPTTGMDPVNKRHVWSFLESFKKGRVIILTTHSMEEADILADRISIMSKGQLKAIGKSIRLKNKFGTGYRISLIIPKADNVPIVKNNIESACPKIILEEEEYVGATAPTAEERIANSETELSKEVKPKDRTGQTCRLVYGATDMKDVKMLIMFLEKTTSENNSMIASFGLSQTTLEDVFLRMIKDTPTVR